MDRWVEQAIALAGLFQAARLVQQVARKGMTEAQALETSLYSILQTSPESVEAVYGDLKGLGLGFETLRAYLSGSRSMELTRYVVALMHLERALARRPAVAQAIAQRLERIKGQAAYFSPSHPQVVAALAELYRETLGTLRPRIMVYGDEAFLTREENVEKVRALLLAGVRSAVLWRQKGGSRLRLLFQRRRLMESLTRALA